MGRVISVELPDETYAVIRERAAARGATPEEFVRERIEAALATPEMVRWAATRGSPIRCRR